LRFFCGEDGSMYMYNNKTYNVDIQYFKKNISTINLHINTKCLNKSFNNTIFYYYFYRVNIIL